MPGWSRDKRLRFEEAFYCFLDNCTIHSKDHTEPICLGTHLYLGQRMFFKAVFDGLEEDIHKFKVLKSRQLGLSTGCRALSTFFIGAHQGLKGALVFDTAPHREEARQELVAMIKGLPASIRFPRVVGRAESAGNREGLALENGSKILFLSAGVKQAKGSGTLGRSVGLALAHRSELCSYDNPEGMEAFDQSLSEINPNRLYIDESTARGYNIWKDIWDEAGEDPAHVVRVFLGWWSKESQAISQEHPDFQLYGLAPPTAIEAKKIKIVRERYGVEITPEQLAWVRRKYDPTARAEGDVDAEHEASTERIQEQPWTEEEAFQVTGAKFFSNEVLTEVTQRNTNVKSRAYWYQCGLEFWNTRIYEARTTKEAELRVWEEPEAEAFYVFGIDPAYGVSEDNDNSCIQGFRAYADGLDQVCEYTGPLVNTKQLAWVLASLLGWYGMKPDARVRYALELQGPGQAVFNEIRSLRRLVEGGTYREAEIKERGLQDIFRNVRTYVYSRMDSFTAGMSFHVKTTQQLKVTFLERLRDQVTGNVCRVRSLPLVEEMRTISRSGDRLGAPASKRDDRVMAAAFAVHCWESGPRMQLVSSRQTREAVAVRRSKSILDRYQLFQKNQLGAFFDQKQRIRTAQQRNAIRQSWRYR